MASVSCASILCQQELVSPASTNITVDRKARLISLTHNTVRPSKAHRRLPLVTAPVGCHKSGRHIRFTRASAVSNEQEVAETEVSDSKRTQLKSVLMEYLAKTNGNFTDTSKEIIASLEQLNPSPDPADLPEKYKGNFIMLNSTMPGVLFKGATLTLGRATFNAFEPVKLQIRMEDVYNEVGVETESAYNVQVLFTIQEEGVKPMEGQLLTRAKYERVSPERLDVVFLSSAMMPRNPEKDLKDWIDFFGPVNPNIDENGVVAKDLPPHIRVARHNIFGR